MKISLNRALAECKLIESKINKKIRNLKVAGLSKKDSLVRGLSASEFIKNASEDCQSIEDLFENLSKLRAGISLANSMTKFKIAEQEFTIAEAIKMKETIHFKEMYLNELKSQFNSAVAEAERHRLKVEDGLQSYLQNTLGNAQKADPKAIEVMTENYYASNKVEVVFPKDLEAKIKDLEEFIEEFKHEVDFKLTEVNATTFIEI